MKKAPKKTASYKLPEETPNMVEESLVDYGKPKLKTVFLPIDLPFSSFKKIIDNSPFTLAEWAGLLQLSERTLNRYAKDDISFNSLYAERIVQLYQLIQEGNLLFKNSFKAWLHKDALAFNGAKPISYLYTSSGITEVYRLIMRIQMGIVA
jgi:uncharacterized protein (DUF2384 family)